MKKILSIALASSFALTPVYAKAEECKITETLESLGIKDKLCEYIAENAPDKLLDCLEDLGVIIDCLPGGDGSFDEILPDIPEVKPEKPEDIPQAPEDIPEIKPEEKPEELPEQKPEQDTPDAGYSEMALEVISLVNKYRAQHGLSALSYEDSLMASAQVRAREQEKLFSHTRPDGTSCFTALDEAGVSYRGAGENIAMGQRSAAAVMDAWMNSEGHRANILNSSFTKIGVGFHVGTDGTYYWSQMFVY